MCGRGDDLNDQLCARQQFQNRTAKARSHMRVHNNALDRLLSMNLQPSAQIKPDQLELTEETLTPERKKPVVAECRGGSDRIRIISVILFDRFRPIPP
jgi:hypothetical protein